MTPSINESSSGDDQDHKSSEVEKENDVCLLNKEECMENKPKDNTEGNLI